MKYTGPIYRPPIEANTVLLQVTVGCAHNRCRFCTMYKDTKFTTESLEQIEKDLREARQLYGDLKRIFLINGDAFVLSANRLKLIAGMIINYFPGMEVISMYASIRNIMAKTDRELKELRDLRIGDLWVGLESGSDEALQQFNKGFTLSDSREQLERLNRAGIKHNAIFMLGALGRGRALEGAEDSVKLINGSRPQLVGITPLGLFPGSELADDVQKGKFSPASEREILEEERRMIELIDVDGMPFYGNHPLNTASLVGTLPGDRKRMMRVIDDSIKSMDRELLEGVIPRTRL